MSDTLRLRFQCAEYIVNNYAKLMQTSSYLNWPEPENPNFMTMLINETDRNIIERMVNETLEPLKLHLHVRWERSDDSGCPQRWWFLDVKFG